jgi:site-specific DNA recombinase
VQAGNYTRISDDKAGDSLGVERQDEDGTDLIDRRGWLKFDDYQDNDKSAKAAGTRPEFTRMLGDIRGGRLQVVVAWSWDRLTRNRRETVELIEACQEHKVLIALVKGSDIDCSTAAGRLVADVLASVARNELDVKSERQVRAYRQQAEAGKPHFVARPYGYTRSGELIEAEAAVLREFADRYLRGWGIGEICRWANDAGIPSATAGTWTNRVIRDHLLSRRNVGIRVYKGEEFPGTWTPVFDMDTHERLIAENKRRPEYVNNGPHSNRRRYLLTGLLYCGRCDQKMTGHRRADHAGKPKRDKYNCQGLERGIGCKGQVRVAETLDHFIREAVLYRLDSPQMAKLLTERESKAEQIEPLQARRAVLKAKLDSLLDDYTDETLTKLEYQRAKRRVMGDLEAVEADLSGLYSSQQAAAVLSADRTLREAWESQSLSWRRNLIGLVVERITVHPSTKRTSYVIDGRRFKFDPSDVDIAWRV